MRYDALTTSSRTVDPGLVSSALAPVEGRFTASDGLPGEAIIFLREGHLDSLEYVYYGELPLGWPRPSDIAVTA